MRWSLPPPSFSSQPSWSFMRPSLLLFHSPSAFFVFVFQSRQRISRSLATQNARRVRHGLRHGAPGPDMSYSYVLAYQILIIADAFDAVYTYLITNYNNPIILTRLVWSLLVEVLFNGFTALLVQRFAVALVSSILTLTFSFLLFFRYIFTQLHLFTMLPRSLFSPVTMTAS